MLFHKGIKKHWIDEIGVLGERFNPDCGNKAPQYEYGDAAPLNLLTGLYGNVKWTELEERFQLPRWLLECVDEHMHNVSPSTSQEDLLTVFEACPTSADMDLLYCQFAKRMCIYMLSHFSGVRAQLSQTYFSPVWADMITHYQLQIDGNTSIAIRDAYTKMANFEVWGAPGNKFLYFHNSLEWVTEKHTSGFVELLRGLHSFTNPITQEQAGEIVFKMLVDTLKGV